ncbi:hypothetical protein K0N88_001214 [Salmonella enterica]|nr:hypothetical protein [Salmonella enterica]
MKAERFKPAFTGVKAPILAAVMLALVSLLTGCSDPNPDGYYLSVGSEADKAACAVPDHSLSFDCGRDGFSLDVEPAAESTIKFRFRGLGQVFNWFYAEKVKSNQWRVVADFPDSETTLTLDGNKLVIRRYNPADPNNRDQQTNETFLKVDNQK